MMIIIPKFLLIILLIKQQIIYIYIKHKRYENETGSGCVYFTSSDTRFVNRAQTLTVQKGLSTVEFNHPSGKVKVYLPDDIRVGDIISGTIHVEPAGKNLKQETKSLSDLKKAFFIIDQHEFSIDGINNKIHFKKEAGLKTDSTTIFFMNSDGK